jgi:type I restriction enzyme S subunit
MALHHPYPSYRQTDLPWLGQIPAHWDVKRLKNALSRNDGGVWGDDTINNDEGVIVLRSTDVGLGGEWNISDPARRNLSATEFQAGRLMAGDLLVTKSSGSSLHLGKTALVTPEIEALNCCFSNFMQRLRASDKFSPEYIYWIMNSIIGREQLNYFGSTTTGLNNLTGTLMGKLFIAAPPLPEQQKIAAYLDHQTAKIDALIARKERLLDLLAEQRAALISQAVTKGLNPAVKMKDSGVAWLGQVPEHWDFTKIKYVAQIGNGSTPLRDNTSYWDDGFFPWLTSTVVNNDIVGEPSGFVSETALRECHLPIVQPNSVLVAITGEGKTRGKAALLTYKATINQHLAFINPQQDLMKPEYLQLFLCCSYEILRMISEGTGSTKGALTCEQLGEYPILLPPLHEQEKIISYVFEKKTKIDSLGQATFMTIERVREYRAALILSVVTGKIQITE